MFTMGNVSRKFREQEWEKLIDCYRVFIDDHPVHAVDHPVHAVDQPIHAVEP